MILKLIKSRVSNEHIEDLSKVVYDMKNENMLIKNSSILHFLIGRYLTMKLNLKNLCNLIDIADCLTKVPEHDRTRMIVVKKLNTTINQIILEIFTRKKTQLALDCENLLHRLKNSYLESRSPDILEIFDFFMQAILEYFNDNINELANVILSSKENVGKAITIFSVISQIKTDKVTQRILKEIKSNLNWAQKVDSDSTKINNATLIMRRFETNQIIGNELKPTEIVEYKLKETLMKENLQEKIYQQIQILEKIKNMEKSNFIKFYESDFNDDTIRLIFECETGFKDYNKTVVDYKKENTSMPNFMGTANDILRSFNDINHPNPVYFRVSQNCFRINSSFSVKIDFVECQEHIFKEGHEIITEQTKIKQLGYSLSKLYSFGNRNFYLEIIEMNAPDPIKKFLSIMQDDSRNQELTLLTLINDYTKPEVTKTLTNEDNN
jgi:hypothetical protein